MRRNIERKTRLVAKRVKKKIKEQPQTKHQLIAIKVPKQELKAFDLICEQYSFTRSEMIRTMIEELLAA